MTTRQMAAQEPLSVKETSGASANPKWCQLTRRDFEFNQDALDVGSLC